jgi:hypothetical protein
MSQLPALIVRQVTNQHPFSHRRSLRDPALELVDATPPTLAVTALVPCQATFARFTTSRSALSWALRFRQAM